MTKRLLKFIEIDGEWTDENVQEARKQLVTNMVKCSAWPENAPYQVKNTIAAVIAQLCGFEFFITPEFTGLHELSDFHGYYMGEFLESVNIADSDSEDEVNNDEDEKENRDPNAENVK